MKICIKTIFSCILLLFISGTHPIYSQDMDADGLLDSWETDGFGPLNPRVHNVKRDKADLIVMPVLRPGANRSEVDAEFVKVKKFFAELPNRNPDGTTGINVVIVYGNILPSTTVGRVYTELYDLSIPLEWRKIAHGYLCEPGYGGGGQTAHSRWSASGYDWRTIVHELGHQLGLEHDPPGSKSGPFYTSLMNYDYSYSFNGDQTAVHFSQGKFASIRLNEANLNEVIDFPEADLIFLTKEPYYYKIQRISARQTSVDWNRNGVFRENNVQADINDGVNKQLGAYLHLNHTSGAPALTSINASLYLVYPKLTGTSPDTWVTAKTRVPEPRGYDLYYQKINTSSTDPEKLLVRSIVKSDPSAIGIENLLAVGFVTGNKTPAVYAWKTDSRGLENNGNANGVLLDIQQKADQVALAVTGRKRWSDGSMIGQETDKLWMFTWNQTTKEVKATAVRHSVSMANKPVLQIATGSSHTIMEGTRVISSDLPIAVAFNRSSQRMLLVTNAKNWGYDNRIKVYTLRLVDNKWVYESHRWVGLESSGFATNAAPTLIIDDTRLGGPEGMITIFVKGNVAPDEASQIFNCRIISDRTYHDGWRVSMMGNQWTSSKSPVAATLMGDNIAFALRWDGGELNNRIVFYRAASGIEDRVLIDYDDIRHISTSGLKNAVER